MTVALQSPVDDLSSQSYHRALLARLPNPGQSEWLLAQKHPTPKLGPGEVLVRTTYVALNPFDWQGIAFRFNLRSEARVMGRDGAGKVVEVGKGVSRFKPGDRVWFCSNSAQVNTGAFQEYSVHTASQVGATPQCLSDESAATLGTGLITAGVALSRALDLSLQDFSALQQRPKSHGDWILVWGGAGITGVYLIQIARCLGYRVICAASPSNSAYVRSLGAEIVLDRWERPDDLVKKVRHATGDKVRIAIDNVGEETAALCHQILAGSKKLAPPRSDPEQGPVPGSRLIPLAGFPQSLQSLQSDEDALRPVEVLRVSFSTTFYANDGYSTGLLDRYTALLESGDIIPARTKFVKDGLHGIEQGLDDLRHGRVPGGFKLVAKLEDTPSCMYV